MSEELLKNNDVNMGTINENGMNEVPCTDQVNNEQSKGDISAADGQESQETLDEVPVDQNNQEKIKSKTLVTLLSFLVRKMPYKVHYLFSYRKAIKHGLKIAFLIGNGRFIQVRLINCIMNSVPIQIRSSPTLL